MPTHAEPGRRGLPGRLGLARQHQPGAARLFKVADDPLTGKAAIIYTHSTIGTKTLNDVTNELPEIVPAFEQ